MSIRLSKSDRSLLILLNAGKMSRNFLAGIAAACGRLGIRFVVAEIELIKAAFEKDPVSAAQQLDSLLVEHRVGAVLGYTCHAFDLPGDLLPGGAGFRTFFEVRGIPHLMYWTDHPQWASNKVGLRPNLQAAFRSSNCFHFVKSEAHAYELSRILGWPNTFDCPLAADAETLQPVTDVTPEYDIVAIYGGQPQPAEWMQPFLAQDDPDPQELADHYTPEIRAELAALWDKQNIGRPMRARLIDLGERLTELRRADPFSAAARHIDLLADEFPQAMRWLTLNHEAYFAMTSIMWRYRGWLREFMLGYLAKHFRVAVFGGDWSAMGCANPVAEGGSAWVDFADIPKTLARGKVVVNLSAGYDEEGITAKPFEIAASGACMVHNHCTGIDEFFTPGKELETFNRPREARDIVSRLLLDDARRTSIGAAARARVQRDHSWDNRVLRMLRCAGFEADNFKKIDRR